MFRDAGVDYTIYIYEGAKHAFHTDTLEARYDPDVAELRGRSRLSS